MNNFFNSSANSTGIGIGAFVSSSFLDSSEKQSGTMILDTSVESSTQTLPEDSILVAGMSAASTTADISSNNGRITIVITGKIFRNNIPYTRVEKHAARSFNNLHPNSKITNKQPFITADTKEVYNAISNLFANKSREQILEDLEVFERILADEQEKNTGI